jgi:hypothetical protein
MSKPIDIPGVAHIPVVFDTIYCGPDAASLWGVPYRNV